MTINSEQIQALKATYANVEKQAHALRGNPREYSVITGLCPVNVIEMQAQKIQALLVESDADKALIAEQAKRIAELQGGQKKLIGWRASDYTDETSDPELAKNWAAAIGVLPIFEGDVNTKLEARTLTVKLPDEKFCPAEYAGSLLWSETEIWNNAVSACKSALEKSCAAAGITLVVGE